MRRFEYLDCGYVNVDTISHCEPALRTDKKCIVHFKDGEKIKLPYYDEERISGADHIIQVFPCTEPITAIYDGNDGTVFEEDVFYLGLCADGSIKPITLACGFYEIIDADNFKGLFRKEDCCRVVKGKRLRDVCEEFGIEYEEVSRQ